MDEEIGFDVIVSGTVPVLAVRGEIDLATAPQLRQHLMAVETDKSSNVVVDLSDVTFLDSTALGVLVSAHKKLRAEGGDLRLVITRPNVTKIFEITGLTELFSIHESREEACG